MPKPTMITKATTMITTTARSRRISWTPALAGSTGDGGWTSLIHHPLYAGQTLLSYPCRSVRGVEGEAMARRGSEQLIIDCTGCPNRTDTECADCLVAYIIDKSGDAVVFDVAEERALRALSAGGLMPKVN